MVLDIKMNKTKIVFAIFILKILGFYVTHAYSGNKDDEDEEDDVGFIIDVMNLVIFLFAGGPEEVLFRVGFLLVMTIVLIFIMTCCNLIQKNKYRPGPKMKAIEWGTRGLTTCVLGNELYLNKSKWGL